jgi:hypothetical protein
MQMQMAFLACIASTGVHYEYEGRQYGAMSVVRTIMEAMWGLSGATIP